MYAPLGAAVPRRAPATLLALASLAFALRGAAAAPEGVKVSVTPVTGAAVEGTFASVAADGLHLADRAAPIPVEQVREARFPGAKIPADSSPPKTARLRLVMKGGEILRGAYERGSADWVELRPPDMPVVRVPFDAVRRMEAEAEYKTACDEPARQRPPRAGTDVAYARSGDAFAGTWVSAGADGVGLEAGGKKSLVPWDDLVVLQVDNEALPPPTGLVGEVETVGGSRLSATEVAGDTQEIAVTTRSGLHVKVPTPSIAAFRWSGGAFVYATDLAWESEYTSYRADDTASFLKNWNDARADRTPLGCPLRVAGTTFRHGLSVYSKSVVKVPLKKGFVRFQARLGIDDETLAAAENVRGDVTARVTVDGREVWTSGASHVKSGEAARVVGPIDVTGVDVLTLEVDFGDGMDVNDRADWGDPVLVR